MFTGLIEDVGKVVGLVRSGESGRLTVSSALPACEIRLGDSVAVNGVCLTVTHQDNAGLIFDVSPETMDRSTLGGLRSGHRVNLERALRLSDRLGGHIVTGHVDCIARVEERREQSGAVVFAFRLLEPVMARYLVSKGSVAINGISLTVNSVTGPVFTVTIIPHTAAMTTLPDLRTGDRVNIETDIIGKYVERLVSGREQAGAGSVTMELLARNGFR
jgi:riboflavin synthase